MDASADPRWEYIHIRARSQDGCAGCVRAFVTSGGECASRFGPGVAGGRWHRRPAAGMACAGSCGLCCDARARWGAGTANALRRACRAQRIASGLWADARSAIRWKAGYVAVRIPGHDVREPVVAHASIGGDLIFEGALSGGCVQFDAIYRAGRQAQFAAGA